MFSIVALIVSFIAASAEAGRVGDITSRNRYHAKENGDVYYIDGQGKWRSTETNEQLFQQYIGGNRLVGLKTGRVYKDYDAERVDKFIKEQNAKFEKDGVPIYYRKCIPYNYKNGERRNYHLFEKKTGRPFNVVSRLKLEKSKNPWQPFSDEEFTIEYLDEHNDMKGTREYGFVSSKWYLYYKLGV